MADKYRDTSAPEDVVRLLILQMDTVLAAYASLKASHAAMALKLNNDTGVTDINYVDSSGTAPATTASQLMGL